MSKILLIYNAPALPTDHPDAESERDILHTVESVERALITHHRVVKLGLTDTPELLIEAVRTHEPEVVFNLFEGFGTRPASEYHIAGMLDWFGVPYTGCPMEAMVLGRDKVRTKHLLRGAGLPTAEFTVARTVNDVTEPRAWPVIVKPAGTDASIGIEQGSVVRDLSSLKKQVTSVLERYGAPVLIETYLPGIEFNVGVVELAELRVLPVAEMVYTPQPGVQWPIVSYASKWEAGSAEDLAMQPRCPAQISMEMENTLHHLALAAFQLLGCRDVARIDMRLDGEARPYVLEVNPNPDLGSSAGLARMLRAAGIGYNQFILQLVKNHLSS